MAAQGSSAAAAAGSLPPSQQAPAAVEAAGGPPSRLHFNLIPTREFGLKLLRFPGKVWLEVGG
jgi:hypothetical protein